MAHSESLAKSRTIYVLFGPNSEQPQDEAGLKAACRELSDKAGMMIEFRKAADEGSLVDQVQAARASAGLIVNPGDCFSSVAVLDALKACTGPVVEVHDQSAQASPEAPPGAPRTAAAAVGLICGLEIEGYRLALRFLLDRNARQKH